MTTLAASDVAAELRRRAPGIGTKKLHKLLYYCQGHYLATFDAPLFADTISAWDMGPVVGSLWHKEKETGPIPSETPLDEAALNTVGYVLSRYGALSGNDLEHLTHSEEPWREADRRRPPGTSIRIKRESIGEYFKGQAADEDEGFLDADELDRWLKGANVDRALAARPDSIEAIQARLQSA